MPAFVVPAVLAFDSYDSLVEGLNEWMDRADLTGVASQMVTLAEAKIRRKVDPLLVETTTTIACTDGVGTLPTDYGVARHVTFNGKVVPQYSQAVGNLIPTGSIPQAWSIEGGRFRVWPAVTNSLTLLYQPSLPAVTSDTQTNDILQHHPDVYFFGAMLFAEGYVANDERAQTFKNLFEEALEETRQYLMRQRFGGPLVPRLSVP